MIFAHEKHEMHEKTDEFRGGLLDFFVISVDSGFPGKI